MKKILWLASWYPNKTDMHTGDFIQRHARAASIFNQIIVLHVVKAEQPFFSERAFEEIKAEGNLTEHILYFKCDISWKPLNKFVSLIKYFRLFRKLILGYIKDKDAPVLAHVHVPLKAGVMALWLKQRFNIKYALTEHYGIYNNVVEDPFKNKNLLFRVFTKKIIKGSCIFSVVSNIAGRAVNEVLLPKTFSVVHNTVDTSLFYYQQKINGKLRFIHVSNMTLLKNVEGIIRAMATVCAENRNLELMLVGKYNSKIYELAEGTGLINKAIFFTGEISYAEVANQMQQAQSLILFSRTETGPCVVLEALCCGLPVITTEVGCVPEVINNHNGILIESENEIALQNAIMSIMSDYDKFNREEISKDAHNQFSYHAIGKQINNLYDQCLSRQ